MIKVIIVGRYSVGKSTLFNRITKKWNIVLEDEGTTIDITKATINFNGINMNVSDTAGFPEGEDQIMESQKRILFEEIYKVDRVVFVADGTTGLSGKDYEIIQFLRENNILNKTIFAINKADKRDFSMNDFYEIGVEKLYPISAKEGNGVFELLEGIIGIDSYIEEEEIIEEKNYPTITVVGKPNVGKSTLFNKILKKERVVVSEKEFTTRDIVKEEIEFKGNKYLLIDTAGIRSKRMHEFGPIYLSMRRTENAIMKSDIVLIMVDGSSRIRREDQKIARTVLENRKASIIVVNKSDLVKNKSEVLEDIKDKLRFLYFTPIVFISAKDGTGIGKVFDLINKVYDSYKAQFKTSTINKIIEEVLMKAPNTSAKIFYATQKSTMPPKFILFVNDKKKIGNNYINFLKKRMIEELSMVGSPVDIELRGRRENDKRN